MSEFNLDFGNIPEFNLGFGNIPRTAPSWMSQGNASLMGYSPNPADGNLNLLGMSSGAGPAQPNFGWNMPTANLGLYGLNTLGNLWSSFQANKIAKDQLAWAKEFGNANLNNSIKQYNTQLTDRANTRMSSMGWTPDQVSTYVDQNKVSR